MRIRVAQSCVRSMCALDEQARAAVKSAVFDFLVSPSAPGFHLHRVGRPEGAFWSLRVSRDLRIIAARVPGGMVLCHADHHERAYAWARRHAFAAPLPPAGGEPDTLEVVQDAGAPAEPPPRATAPSRGHAGREEPPQRQAPMPPATPAGARRLRLRMRAEAPLPPPAAPGAARCGPAPIAELMRLFRRTRGSGADVSGAPVVGGARPEPPLLAVGARFARVVVALSAIAVMAPFGVAMVCASFAGAPSAALVAAATGALAVAASVRAILALVRRERAAAIARPVHVLTEALERLGRGDLPPPVTERLGAAFDPARDAVNAILEFMRLRGEDIRLALGAAPRTDGVGGEIAR